MYIHWLIDYSSNKKGYKCYHPKSCHVFITMDLTFHETKYIFVNIPLQGEKSLDVEELFFLSLPQLSLHNTQDPSDEATTNGIKPNRNEEDKFFGKKYKKKKNETTHFDSKTRRGGKDP